eukprot:5313154-Amphidinium_carterae.1
MQSITYKTHFSSIVFSTISFHHCVLWERSNKSKHNDYTNNYACNSLFKKGQKAQLEQICRKDAKDKNKKGTNAPTIKLKRQWQANLTR